MISQPICRLFGYAKLLFLSYFCLFGDDQQNYPEIIETKKGIFEFGKILINKEKRQFSIPAVCNQTSGLIEYALVHNNGKIHESLFRTSVSPRLIHATLLLLKQNPQSNFFRILENDKAQLSNIDVLEISVEWEHNGSRQVNDLHSMALNQADERKLAESAFVFTGSKVIEGNYLAEEDGSIVAIYHDNRATINCMDEQSNSDDVWIANSEDMPPKNLPVRIRFQLPKSD